MSVDWTIVIAAYAAGLATATNLASLVKWMLRKSEERTENVKLIFKEVLGPIRSLAQGLDSENPYAALTSFLEDFRPYKDKILGSHHDLAELAPQIASKLIQLIDIIDKETNGAWRIWTLGIVEDKMLKSLVKQLGIDIYDWLADHS